MGRTPGYLHFLSYNEAESSSCTREPEEHHHHGRGDRKESRFFSISRDPSEDLHLTYQQVSGRS